MGAFTSISRAITVWILLTAFAVFPEPGYAQESVATEINERLQLAGKLQRQGEIVRASSEFRQALGLTLEQLGGIYRALDDLGRAEVAYRSAIEAKADSDDALLGLAIVYLRKREFEKGVDAVKILLAQNPTSSAARHLLGKLYFTMGRTDAAVFELEEAARLTPDDYSVATALAMAYLKQERVDNAKRIFSQMLEKVGESPRLHIFFGAVYRQTDLPVEAATEFRRAAALDPKYPRVHYYLGLSYLTQEGRNKIPEAVTEFQTELRRDPNDYLTNYLLGLVYLGERKLEDAVPLLEKAMQLEANKPDAPLFLGQAFSLMGQEEKAIPILLRAIQLTVDPARNHYQISKAHYLLSQALRRQGKVQEAARHAEIASRYKTEEASESVESLQAFLKSSSENSQDDVAGPQGSTVIVEPQDLDAKGREQLARIEKVYVRIAGDAYDQLALLSVGQSDFKRAAKYFEQAANWDPQIQDIDYNLGLARFKAEQFRDATAALERALKLQPDRLPVRVLLGLSYFFADDYTRAAQQLGPVADAGIDDPQVLFALGFSLANAGNRERGKQILRDLLQKHPEVAEFHLALGRLWALEGDFATATGEFAKALELNRSLSDAHYFEGLSLLKQYRFEEAAEEFRKEIQLNPRHAKAQYHLGYALISLQQMEEAAKQFEEAIRLAPEYVDASYELAKIRLQQSRVEDAIKLLEKATQLDPNRSYVFYQLSQAYSKAGRQPAAQEAMSHYRELKAKEHRNSP